MDYTNTLIRMDYTNTPIRIDFKYTDDTKMSGSLIFYYVLDLISEIKNESKATEVITKASFIIRTKMDHAVDTQLLLDRNSTEGEEIEILY